jgi:transcriptional regulator with XRE-family HTH domain
MDLKSKIIDSLKQTKYSYSDLADYLTISESELDKALETKSLDIRTLEMISKELRIPLYSFFHDENLSLEKLYLKKLNLYSSKNKNNNVTELESLMLEIEFLKKLLSEKEEALKFLLKK